MINQYPTMTPTGGQYQTGAVQTGMQVPIADKPKECPGDMVWNPATNQCELRLTNSLPPVPGTQPPASGSGDPNWPNPNDNPTVQDKCWDPTSMEYNTLHCKEIRGSGKPGGSQDPNHPCNDPGDPQYNTAQCKQYRGETTDIPGGPPQNDGVLPPPGDNVFPPGMDPGPAYETTMPNVDPYDVSQSPDWMNMGTEIGGQSAVDPQANQFGYDQVHDFSDAAYQNSMRYLEPQIEQMDDRFAQDLINKGIDPNSEAGQEAFRQKSMAQSDMMSKAAFDAMGFGAGIQDQMFGQDATRSQLANALMQSQWGLNQRGHEFDTESGFRANDQAFQQMLALEGLNYRDYLSMVDQNRYQDSLALALSGMAPGPQYSTVGTGMTQAPLNEYSYGMRDWSNLWS